jgi:hypothetical protein
MMASLGIMRKMDRASTLSRIKLIKELSKMGISTVTELSTTGTAMCTRELSSRTREKVMVVFKLQG